MGKYIDDIYCVSLTITFIEPFFLTDFGSNKNIIQFHTLYLNAFEIFIIFDSVLSITIVICPESSNSKEIT